MKKAALIYNPTSGQKRTHRLASIEAAAKVLQESGVATTIIATVGGGSAGWQAGEAITSGHDAIFACGGDGTVHDVLQGMVAFGPDIPLGVIPLGTGNVLAFDLGIPRDPAKAAQKQLSYSAKRIASGHIEFQSRSGGRDSRYFTLMAGVGPDAMMLYRVSANLKRRFGILEYARQALKVAFAHPYEEFELVIGGEPKRSVSISQLSAVRVTNLGNHIRYFAMDSGLTRDDLHAVLVSTPSRVNVIGYFMRRSAKKKWKIEGVESTLCSELSCRALPGLRYVERIYAQADGELLGTLPVQIRIVPRAFTLLMPPVT